ncbi:MAG: SCO family protein [Oligoflexia bacterium]|nr:SCO family protein [Oligoflexia bacterium]
MCHRIRLICRIGYRAAFVFFLVPMFSLIAAEDVPDSLKEVAVMPGLGSELPLNEIFVDEEGKDVALWSYFKDGKPVVLIMNYYSCPMLCGLLLNGARDSLARIQSWSPGQQYKIVTISIDPKEGADLAKAKKESILETVPTSWKPGVEKNWHFLTGKNGSEARLAKIIGFGYKWIEEEKQYAHGAALFLVSPVGKVTRVLTGLDFPERDLKLGLLEAGQGKVGTIAEKFMLFCYHYNPKENKYALLASRLVTLAAIVTLVVMAVCYLLWFLKGMRKGK